MTKNPFSSYSNGTKRYCFLSPEMELSEHTTCCSWQIGSVYKEHHEQVPVKNYIFWENQFEIIKENTASGKNYAI